jgi:hypothetical protein
MAVEALTKCRRFTPVGSGFPTSGASIATQTPRFLGFETRNFCGVGHVPLATSRAVGRRVAMEGQAMEKPADGEQVNSREAATLEWEPFKTFSSYRAEHVVVGNYELMVVQQRVASNDALTLWDVFGPPRHSALLGTGTSDSFDMAKAAAELALATLRNP